MPSMLGRFQAANTRHAMSSLDPGGYCAMWTSLMMDVFAYNVAHGAQVDDAKAVGAAIDGIELPKDQGPLWRKLIIDYTFSRLMWAYRLAQHIGSNTTVRIIKRFFIDPYFESANGVNPEAIDNDILEYVKDGTPDLLTRIEESKGN